MFKILHIKKPVATYTPIARTFLNMTCGNSCIASSNSEKMAAIVMTLLVPPTQEVNLCHHRNVHNLHQLKN